MGARTSLLVFSDGNAPEVLRAMPALDRQAAQSVAEILRPGQTIEAIGDGTLGENSQPDDGDLYIGAYPGLTIVCTSNVIGDHPSKLPARILTAVRARDVYVHAMHSVSGWFAYAHWSQGTLRRALSLTSAETFENMGTPMPFEAPYWESARDHEQAFHPLDLGEEALHHLFGFTIEGIPSPNDLDPWEIPLVGYSVIQDMKGRTPW